MKAIRVLQKNLEAASDPQTKVWFENYLKNILPHRGVKTPQVIAIVSAWLKSEKIDAREHAEQLSIACELIMRKHAEDKFAGILLIQKNLLERIEFSELADQIEILFESGAFTNWATTDSMNGRVLSPLIHLHGKKAVSRFSSWVDSHDLWQRRSSIVSLRACVELPRYFPVIRKVIEQLSHSQERFIQTGIGWVIADLSKKHPKEAENLVDRYLARLSMEVVRRHTKHMKLHKKYLKQRVYLNSKQDV